jgi:hypothetical protein
VISVFYVELCVTFFPRQKLYVYCTIENIFTSRYPLAFNTSSYYTRLVTFYEDDIDYLFKFLVVKLSLQ